MGFFKKQRANAASLELIQIEALLAGYKKQIHKLRETYDETKGDQTFHLKTFETAIDKLESKKIRLLTVLDRRS